MKILKHSEISEDLIEIITEKLNQNKKAKIGLVIFDEVASNQDIRNKIIHDIRSGFRTLNNALENIKDGYKFDDNMAELKISAIEKSIAQLNQHLSVIEEINRIPDN